MTLCVCDSGLAALTCCDPLHQGKPAATPEQLMRSRYSAFVKQQLDYLIETTHPAQQSLLDRAAISAWSSQSQWLGLEVLQARYLNPQQTIAEVEFKARWAEQGQPFEHLERSFFVQRADQRWYFLDPTVKTSKQRNQACLCGSGKKLKHCCLKELALLS